MGMPTGVEEFLSRKGLWLDGELVDPIAGRYTQDLDPGTGDHFADFALADSQDVNGAVQAARGAFEKGGWSGLSLEKRAQVLDKFANIVEEHSDRLAYITSRDVGKPLSQADGEVENVALTARYYAGLLREFEPARHVDVSGFKDTSDIYMPLGVCGIIQPWNFPTLLWGWNVMPAIAAGNSVVVKPAEDTPLAALYLAQLAQEAGIPDGVINVVTGYGQNAGEPIAQHPDVDRISFTGSPEVAALLGKYCMDSNKFKLFSAESGGKGAAVFFEDADIDGAVDGIVGALRLNSGQVCSDPTRLFIHESIYDRVVEMLVEGLRSTQIGYGLDEPEMGPVVSEKQRRRVLGMIDDGLRQGAEYLLKGGEAIVEGHLGGFYVKPALLTGELDNLCCTDEIFGPVAFIRSWSSEDKLVEEINRSPYGLSNVVFSEDVESAKKFGAQLRAGNLWINSPNLSPPGAHYAGIGKSGVHGGVNSPDCLDGYFRRTSVIVQGK